MTKEIVILTGSRGFIGSEIYKRLNELNIETIRLSHKKLSSKKLRSDFLDFQEAIKILPNLCSGRDVILIHCAWAGVAGEFRDNEIQVAENLSLIHNVINIVSTLNVRKIIALGSQAEYGNKNFIIKEDEVCEPSTSYGMAKLAHYYLWKAYCNSRGIDFVWARIFSTYGAGDNDKWLLPYCIISLSRNLKVELTKCIQTWDYLHVKDAAQMIVGLLVNGAAGIYNISSADPVVLKDLISKIGQLMQKTHLLDFGARDYRPNEPLFLLGDNQKVMKQIGFFDIRKVNDEIHEMIQHYG